MNCNYAALVIRQYGVLQSASQSKHTKMWSLDIIEGILLKALMSNSLVGDSAVVTEHRMTFTFTNAVTHTVVQ